MTEIEYIRVKNLTALRLALKALNDVAGGRETKLRARQVQQSRKLVSALIDNAFNALGELEGEDAP